MLVEFDALLVLFGATAFALLSRALIAVARNLSRARATAGERASKLKDIEDDAAFDEVIQEQDEPMAEPVPEPGCEPEPGPAEEPATPSNVSNRAPGDIDRSVFRWLTALSGLALLILLFTGPWMERGEMAPSPLRLSTPLSTRAPTVPQRTADDDTSRVTAHEVREQAEAAVVAPLATTAPVPPGELPLEAPAPAPSSAPSSESSGTNALTVKLTRQAVGDESGEDFVRSAYYGTLMVGSPPEPFTVVFDTGSGHLVLPSTYCRSETCKAHKRFRRSASSTALDINGDGKIVKPGQMRDQIGVSFGTGDVSGVFVQDVICLDGMSRSEAWKAPDSDGEAPQLPPGCIELRFIAATELSEDPFKEFQFDGIMGLGLDGLSQTPEFNYLGVVAQSLRGWGGDRAQTFAVFLAESEQEDSEITLGGWAKDHLVEDLSWGSVLDPEMGHWILPIKGLRVNNEKLNFCDDGTCKAAVDTGTSLLAVPTAAFPVLYDLMKRPAVQAGHCQGSGPLFHIEFDEFTVTLGPRDYARLAPAAVAKPRPVFRPNVPKKDNTTNATDSNATASVGPSAPVQARAAKAPTTPWRKDLRCLPTLMTLDLPEPLGPKLFILGEPVLRKYYTVYDGEKLRVGFGRARHHLAVSRQDLLLQAAGGLGDLPLPRRSRPTMFDVFRWRKALR